jgi:hypothetical protein
MPFIHTAYTNLQLLFHKDAAKKGWVTERKVQAQFVVSSPWMRYQCDIVEGKSKKPDRRLADQIDRELRALAGTNWKWSARRHANKAFAITTRALALGHVQDLTDPETSTQWVRIWILAYTIGYAAGKIMMGPDLVLSNFPELDIVYYAPGYELDIKGFQNSYALICDLWDSPVIIEPYPGLPQAVRIRPLQVSQVESEEISANFAEMPTLDEVSFGTSLLNAKQHITFSFAGKENIENMLVVGMTRSGKSTWVQNALISFMRMREQVQGMSYLDGSYSPGVSILREIGIRVASSKETVQSEIHALQEMAVDRDVLMDRKGWIKWPVGALLDAPEDADYVAKYGDRTGVYIIVIDETHKFFTKFPHNSSIEGGIVKNWPTDLLKRGIMIISLTPNFTEKEGPTLFWQAFEWNVMFHIKEAVAVQRMFHRDKGAPFKFDPLHIARGQFVMQLPGAMDLVYGMGHPPMILKILRPNVDE